MKRILVIEDDTDMREAMESTLENAGYEVEAVETSEEGLRAATDHKPDLIFLDVMTHSLHASAFLERLRALPPGKNDSKVVIVTNLDNDITRQKVKEYGVSDFFVKIHTSLEQIVRKAKELIGT